MKRLNRQFDDPRGAEYGRWQWRGVTIGGWCYGRMFLNGRLMIVGRWRDTITVYE